MKLIPLVPGKPAVEATKKAPANKLRKRRQSNSTHSQASTSRPGTPTSQNSDHQRQPNKLRKRSCSISRSSPEPSQQGSPALPPPSPVQVQEVLTKDGGQDGESRTGILPNKRPTTRFNGPPPSPSYGKRFDGVGAPPRSPKRVVQMRSSSAGLPAPSPPRKSRPFPKDDWEII